MTTTQVQPAARLLHRGAGTGPSFWGPGDRFVLEGRVEFLLGEETVVAGPGDFVNVPRGLVHRFRNAGTETARLVLTFTPAGIEGFFEETLDTAPSDAGAVPDNLEDVAARYAAVAPRYGMTFL